MKIIRLARVMGRILRCIRYLMMICVGIQIVGCGALLRHNASVSDENTPEASREGDFVGEDVVNFKWVDLDVSVQVQNHKPSFGFVQFFFVPIIPIWATEKKVQEGEYLVVWINISPKDNGFTFDPGRVVLKLDDGTRVQVKEYIGPSSPWQSARTIQLGCGQRRYSLGVATSRSVIEAENIKKPQGPIPVLYEKESRGKCFLLGFDTDDSPDRTFVLSIGGIDQGGAQYPIPDIRFRKGAVWDMLPVP